MAYALSEQTAQKLKQLIDDKPGSMAGPGSPVFASRIAGFVLITGEPEGGLYPATIQVYDVLEATWNTKDDCLVLEANEKKLTVDERYIAVRYGMKASEGKSVWVVGVTLPDVDCGLFYDEDDEDKLKIDGDTLAGAGINWNEDDCNLYLDPGCGITLEGGKKIGVQSGALAGEGLFAGPGCKLNVNAGTCLEVDEDGKLNVTIDGTFSAITALSLTGSCPNLSLSVTTSAFAFNDCNLEQVSYNESTIPIPCCDCDDPPPSYWWCVDNTTCTEAGSQPENSTGPFNSEGECTEACTYDPPDCDDCTFTVTVNGTLYTFGDLGGTYYVDAGDGTAFYLTTPGSLCEGTWQVSHYDGAWELCRWEATWNGSGCVTLEQTTNNGIPFTECVASEVTLCCDGDPPPPESAFWCCEVLSTAGMGGPCADVGEVICFELEDGFIGHTFTWACGGGRTANMEVISGPYADATECGEACVYNDPPPSCTGACVWTWNGSEWEITATCYGSPECEECVGGPSGPGSFVGEEFIAPCNSVQAQALRVSEPQPIDASKADVPAVWNRKDWITPVELPPLAEIVPTKPFAVVTCAVGEKGRQLLELSEPSLRKYADKIGADFHVIRGVTPLVPPYPMFDKFRLGKFFDHYERIVFIDADIVVRDDAPNLLDVVPDDHVGLHDDLPKNSGGYAWYFTEVEHVQRWQKLKLQPVPFCLNTGLIVASRQHRAIFDPATEPFQAIHCFEQHLINCRIAAAAIPVHLFDSETHWQWWFDKRFRAYPKAKFVHFAGLQDHGQRLRLMEMASAEVAV